MCRRRRSILLFIPRTAASEIYNLSLHDALPISHPPMPPQPLGLSGPLIGKTMNKLGWHWWPSDTTVATSASRACSWSCRRSEEHTSELQSRQYLVCRLLLQKKIDTLRSKRHGVT